MLLSEKDARSACDRVLSFVKADDAEVSLESEDYSHLRFAANALTTSGRREATAISATVWIGKRKGTASTTELDEQSLQAVVAEA